MFTCCEYDICQYLSVIPFPSLCDSQNMLGHNLSAIRAAQKHAI